MRFAHPYFLLLLLVIPVLFIPWLKLSASPRVLISLFNIKPETQRFRTHWLSTALKCLALGFCIVALARPQSVSKTQDRKANGIDIMMTLDVSLSMLIQDMGESSRMEIAKQMFRQFIEGRKNDRIGFIIFAGEPVTLAPPTLDYGMLLAHLQTVEPGGPGLRDGTAIGDGLALGINRLKKSTAKSRVIILLTDGDNNLGRIDPLTAGELALGYGIKVYSIAIGTEGRVKQPLPQRTAMGTVYTYVWVENRLNPSLLQQISEKTNGKFFRVTDEKALLEVFKEIDRLEKTDVVTQDKVRYNEEFARYLLIALLFLAFEQFLTRVWWRQWA